MIDIPSKKLHSGFTLPVYGLGLWEIGGRGTAETKRDTGDITAIQQAIEHGVRHIDTAESYGDGHAEELLGTAIRGYRRSDLILATKVSEENQSYDGIRRACEMSLRRLGTDYLDLYLLHRYPIQGIHVSQTMRALDELVDQGVIKNIGVSNLTLNRFQEVQKHTKYKLVCNQLHYNVQYREVEGAGLVEFLQKNDIMLVAWRPIQKRMLPKSTLLDELARKYDKTPIQIAINWLISQANVVTISKTSDVNHLEENLGAVGWIMEKTDIERIREEFPDQQSVSDAVPLNYSADIHP